MKDDNELFIEHTVLDSAESGGDTDSPTGFFALAHLSDDDIDKLFVEAVQDSVLSVDATIAIDPGWYVAQQLISGTTVWNHWASNDEEGARRWYDILSVNYSIWAGSDDD